MENNNNAPATNMQEKRAVIRELLEQGKEKGSLIRTEIIEELEKYDFTTEQINVIIDELRKSGVEIEEAFSVEDIKDLEDIEEEANSLPIDPEDMEVLLQSEGITIDDPVKIYLHEIGRVALLTPE
ncbi:MAG: hypothetical protein IJF23_04545, partial [Clostridia bacterium]|nr:hypothetical protein [Clostridia bacterium]